MARVLRHNGKRPDGTKLLKRKEHAHVYHGISSEYQPDKKYNTEKKACIGKLASEAYDVPE